MPEDSPALHSWQGRALPQSLSVLLTIWNRARLVSLLVLQAMLLTVQTPSTPSEVRSTPSTLAELGPGIEKTPVPPQAPREEVDPQSATGSDGQAKHGMPDQQDIVVKARKRTPGDPLESVNVRAFAITDGFDRAVLDPASRA